MRRWLGCPICPATNTKSDLLPRGLFSEREKLRRSSCARDPRHAHVARSANRRASSGFVAMARNSCCSAAGRSTHAPTSRSCLRRTTTGVTGRPSRAGCSDMTDAPGRAIDDAHIHARRRCEVGDVAPCGPSRRTSPPATMSTRSPSRTRFRRFTASGGTSVLRSIPQPDLALWRARGPRTGPKVTPLSTTCAG